MVKIRLKLATVAWDVALRLPVVVLSTLVALRPAKAVALVSFAVKRRDPSARVAHPDLRKGDLDTKVVGEKDSIGIELDDNYSREGKTSRVTHKSNKECHATH